MINKKTKQHLHFKWVNKQTICTLEKMANKHYTVQTKDIIVHISEWQNIISNWYPRHLLKPFKKISTK